MAAIPTYLYFGDGQITGGPRPPVASPYLWGFYLNNWRFSRVVPSSADGLTPPASTFSPYWDGTMPGGGAFVRYHYIPGLYIPGALGDNWFDSVSGGGGVSPCTMLANALWDRHPIAPGFKLLKYGVPNAGYGSWKPGGAAWIAAKAQFDAAVIAAAGGSDTLDVQAVIIDCSGADIATSSPTFSLDAQAFIDGVRANYSSTAKIILVSHRPDYCVSSGTAAQAARQIHKLLATANTGVSVFDMSFATFGTDGFVGGVSEGPNKVTYELEDYIEAGVRLGRHIDHLLTGQTLSSVGGALETHVIIGDSNAVTTNISPQIAVLGGQGSLLGNTIGSTERQGEWIWDAQNEEVVAYDVLGVTNSFGSVTAEIGPECTLLRSLKERARARTQNPDVCIWKYAQGGAQLGYLDSALPALEEQWEKFKAAAYRDTGRTIDCRSVLVMIGRNDGVTAGGAATFATKHLQLVDEARRIFTTRADGPELAVVWVQPSPHLDSGVAGGTTLGDAAALAAVRAHVAALPQQRPRVRVLLDADARRYELQRVDRLHYGAEAVFAIGADAADAIYALNSEEGGTEGADTGDSPSGSAAFTVETGTGSATANSYCTVAFADSYHGAYGNPSLWTSASSAAKQNAIRRATRGLDERFAERWNGRKASSTQSLAWPRIGVVDASGSPVGADTIPTRLQQAAARGALFELEGKPVMPDTISTADIASESRSMAGGFSKTVTYRGAKPGVEELQALERMLQADDLIETAGGWGYAEA